MSVERMYKKMKKSSKAVEPTVLTNGGISAEEERFEKKPMKKKKKAVMEEVELEAASALSDGGTAADEPIEEMHKKKKKKKERTELDDAAKPSNGGEESSERVHKRSKTETADLDDCQDGVTETTDKKNRKEKKEKKETKAEKKKQKKGNNNKAAKMKHSSTAAAASRAEGPSSDGSKAADTVPEPVGMQIYWNLSNVEASVREAASVALVRELGVAQKAYEDSGLGQEEKAAEAVILGEAKVEEEGLKGCAPAVQYALRRLVRGVGSSRESARQGFALALASVLGALAFINRAAIVTMVDNHLEVTSSMKGQEARDALLGQLFAYGALIRSARVIGAAATVEEEELAKEVTERLLTLAKKKTFLQEAAAYALVELGEKLDGSGILKGLCAAPLLLDSLTEEANSISPDTFFLALSFHRKLPKSVFESCALIPDSGNLADIFEKDHLLRLLPCLKESTSSHPQVHSVWEPLLRILFAEEVQSKPSKKNKRNSESVRDLETRLVTFWSTVVDGALLPSSHERKHLAMQLLLLVLPRLPAASYVQYILSGNFIRCLLDAIARKENLLCKSAQNCIAELCKWAEADEDRRIRVVIALQQNSQGKFDQMSKTQSVKGLLSGITTISGYQAAFQALASLYLSGEAVEEDVLVNAGLSSKKQKVPVEVAEDEGGKDAKRDPGHQRWAVDQLRAICQQALSSLPANTVIDELIAKLVPSLPPLQPFTEEEEASVQTLQSTMLQVSSALFQVESGEKKDRLQAMLSLLVQLLFESRLVPSIVVEIASEITICCNKAFGDLVELPVESRGDGEEPAFMDVLVDVLLSLLAQPSAPIRAAAEQVFKSFSGDLTSSGLTDLLRIVKKNTQRSRHKPVVEVDNQKDDDDDILDVEDSDADSVNEDGTDDDEEDDSDSDEEKDTKVLPSVENTRSSIKKGKQDKPPAMGVKKDDDDGDEEDEDEDGNEGETSDMDDETMFRMDKHLENILKQRKQGGANGTEDSKDAQTQLMHFKFRVLALLDFFLQKHSGSLLVLTMLPSLLHVFVNSCTTDGNSQVADRVSAILQKKLFKGKQYPRGPDVDQTSLRELLRKALKLASRSTVKKVSVMAQATCHWILKVIHGNLIEEKDTDVEEMFSAVLEDFFAHKKCRLPSSFFKETFTRNQWLGNSLLGLVLEKCTAARSEYLQFEALQLASTILGFKSGKFVAKSAQPDSSLEATRTALKPHLQSLSNVVIHCLKEAPSAKAVRRIEAMQFCASALELHQALYPRKSLAKFVTLDSSVAAALSGINAPAKSKLSNLVVKVQLLLVAK